jgi:chaperone BCS1
VSAIPGGSILLIEDIDVAFPSRSDEEEGDRYNHPKRGTEVTLSGLLNVLDGIASDENKLFFATVCSLSLSPLFQS